MPRWPLLQVVHVIRHGESEFNAAANTSKGFEDPQIFNPGLTAKGQSQVSLASADITLHCSFLNKNATAIPQAKQFVPPGSRQQAKRRVPLPPCCRGR